MKKLFTGLIFLLFLTSSLYAITWDSCIEKYKKAKQFSENTKLMYIYLKSTKSCLKKFKKSLVLDPSPEFTIEAMNNNIEKIDTYINELIPNYQFQKISFRQIPKYVDLNAPIPILNKEYDNFIKFKGCNGVHAGDKIYTAKHCDIENSTHVKYDLSYLSSKKVSKLKTSKLDLNKLGSFKYYSMSKEGMFYKVLLQEDNCKFYKAKIVPNGINTSLDLADLEKKEEIRSDCLAIPSNSGGGVFQNDKLVGIISKTVFNNNQFVYSVIEPIHSMNK